MLRHVQGAIALAVFAAMVVGLGCFQSSPAPVEPPVDAEPVPPIDVPAEDLKALVDGNNQFAIDLYKQVAAKQDGNLILSPYSISSALAMTYAGARGQTADEMKKTLHFTLPPEKLHPAFGALAQQLQGGNNKSGKLNAANALWGQKGFHFRPDFLALTSKYYAGGFRELDFSADPSNARQVINRWVEQKTEERVKELLKPNDITQTVRLVITNALYFKGEWAVPFPAEVTREGEFEIKPGIHVKLPMMTVNSRFRYHSDEAIELVEVPFCEKNASMIVLLPKQGCALAGLEASLSLEYINRAISKMRYHEGELGLPRFEAGSRLKLNSHLQALGMRLPFSNADFSGIEPSGGLAIEAVIHGADIKVDEKGSEAAAASVVILGVSAPPPFRFQANHPFLYVILDRDTRSILFQGRFGGP